MNPPPPEPNEFVVSRVGDGTTNLTAVTAPVFIERRTIADGTLIGSPLGLPTTADGSNRPLTLSGNASSEGALTLSADGHYVLIAGYDAPVNAVHDSVNRVIGRVSSNYTIDTTTSFDALNGTGNNIRSAASTDGNTLWAAGVTGIISTTLGSPLPPTQLLGSTFNMRVLGIFGGQLYASRSSDISGGIATIGTGLPTTGNAPARQLPGFPNVDNTLSPYGFLALDRAAPAGIDTLYIADDRTNGEGGIQRWALSNDVWLLQGIMSTGSTSGARGLAGFVSRTNVVLIVATAEVGTTPTRLLWFSDNGGQPSLTVPKVLATAQAKTAFRGIALAPK